MNNKQKTGIIIMLSSIAVAVIIIAVALVVNLNNNNNQEAQNNQEEQNKPTETDKPADTQNTTTAGLDTIFPITSTEGTIVATVADQEIRDFELNFMFCQYRNSLMSQMGTDDPQQVIDFFESEEGSYYLQRAEEIAVQNVTLQKILVSKARENNISLTETEINEMNDSINQQASTQFASREEADQTFGELYGTNFDQYKYIIGQQELANKYYSDELGKITVSKEEARNLYDGDPDQFKTVAVRHILIKYENDAGRSKDDGKKLADDILQKVKSGDDMVQLADSYSEDPGVVDNHGLYSFGTEAAYSYDPSFYQWSMKASKGDSDIVESSSGYHIMKLEDQTKAEYESVEEQIISNIKNETLYDTMNKWAEEPKYQYTAKG